jgi:hypothetical protein
MVDAVGPRSVDLLEDLQAGSMSYLDADRWYTYDTLNRVVTAKYQDTQAWLSLSPPTSWYSFSSIPSPWGSSGASYCASYWLVKYTSGAGALCLGVTWCAAGRSPVILRRQVSS